MDDGEGGTVRLNCQQCDQPVTFTDVGKLSLAVTKPAQGNYLVGSYVDVPGAAASKGLEAPRAHALGALTQVFESAANSTHIDHPLCARCLDHVTKELQDRTAAAEARARAYQDALAAVQEEIHAHGTEGGDEEAGLTRLQSAGLTVEQLERQLQAAEREERVELERAERLEAELAAAEAELAALDEQDAALREEEATFWRRYNSLSLNLADGQDEVEALTAKTDAAARHLDELRQTCSLALAFPIGVDGHFGTISGFRLGRWKEEVQWSETNAAWGQAVLLLDTMARMYPAFKWRGGVLRPMSSHSEISDGKGSYKLYGPVGSVWAAQYDRAIALFLSCLHDFNAFACEHERREQRPPPDLPNAIDVERGTVHGVSTRFSGLAGSGKEAWNKALKALLVNLKLMQHWVIRDQGLKEVQSHGASQAPARSPGGQPPAHMRESMYRP